MNRRDERAFMRRTPREHARELAFINAPTPGEVADEMLREDQERRGVNRPWSK